IVFNRWFALRTHRTDRLRFWCAYVSAGGMRGSRQLPDDLEQRTLQSNLAFWRQQDRRCLADNRYFRKVRAGDVSGHAVVDLEADNLAAFLADPDEPLRRPGVKVLKHSPSSNVVELELPGKDGP